MAEFSASDAAFVGFRIVWERPLSILSWTILAFAVSLAEAVFFSYSIGPLVGEIRKVGLSSADSPEAAILFDRLLPSYVVLLIATLVLASVLYAAMNRAVLRPTERRFGYLRLGSDELRQLGLFCLLTVLLLALTMAVAFVSSLVTALLMRVVGQQAGLALGFVVLLVGSFCTWIFVLVRLSLASPMTFATGRIDLAAAWRLSQGRFWPLFGTYLIAFSLWLVVFALFFAIASAASDIASIVQTGKIGGAEPASLSVMDVFEPSSLAFLIVMSIGSALTWPINMSPPAAIYRAIAGGGTR